MKVNEDDLSGPWGVLQFTDPLPWTLTYGLKGMDVRIYELELLWSADFLERLDLTHYDIAPEGTVKSYVQYGTAGAVVCR